jgi:hypothetical protein
MQQQQLALLLLLLVADGICDDVDHHQRGRRRRPRHLSLRRAAAARLSHPVPSAAEVTEALLPQQQALPLETGTSSSLRRALPADTGGTVVSVVSYGAVADGTTDNTHAFQSALLALAPAGGVAFVPSGNYSFAGTLTLPLGVSLVGESQSIMDAPGFPGGSKHAVHDGGGIPTTGSILLARSGRGNESSTPFLTLNENAAVRGLTLFYPDNRYDAVPAAYPWAINMVGDNSAVLDCLLLNPWLGIQAMQANRHYIARVQGQPVKTGIFIDATFDIGRVEDVHWMHLYSVHDSCKSPVPLAKIPRIIL